MTGPEELAAALDVLAQRGLLDRVESLRAGGFDVSLRQQLVEGKPERAPTADEERRLVSEIMYGAATGFVPGMVDA